MKRLLYLTTCLLLCLKVAGATATWISSTASQKWQQMPDPVLVAGSRSAPPNVLIVPSRAYQTIDGFGGCFNELGWTALKAASKSEQAAVLNALFSDNGCAFTLGRFAGRNPCAQRTAGPETAVQ